MTVPAVRISPYNNKPLRRDGDYVLYWMIASRRPHDNFALERAAEIARDMQKPLIVLEALRCDYPYSSDRLHKFILGGMVANAKAFARTDVAYYPYIEPERDAGKGLLAALGESACAVVTDDFPAFFLPAAVKAAAKQLKVRLETVDSAGLLPMAAIPRVFTTAHAFRRFLQRNLLENLKDFPSSDPLAEGLPRMTELPHSVVERWTPTTGEVLRGETLSSLPIDHGVATVKTAGGYVAAESAAREFVGERLRRYADDRNHPDEGGTSGLSPYLHFGHISTHQIVRLVGDAEGWSLSRTSGDTSGSREGWWGMSPSAEAFLDQVVTWRELGYNFCHHRTDYADYESLPEWARVTLEVHASDPRDVYPLDVLEAAETADDVWNAAQRQLLREGVIHNYLRMLWGKRILEWSETPREALGRMMYLNDKYAIDGRDPNSYSGIFWCLGRYDRAWGPERPVFGKVRYMSSRNTARKLRLKRYLERFS
jgi:deoxyribodipyrimidine photo-lyase